MSDKQVNYGLKYQGRVVRCISQAGQPNSQWIVGTNSLREENEVHILQSNSSEGSMECLKVFPHSSEVWDIAPCPKDPSKFVTIHNHGGSYGGTLWSWNKNEDKLNNVCELPVTNGVLRRADWCESNTDNLVVSGEGGLKIVKVGDGQAKCEQKIELEGGWSGKWHPQDPNVVITLNSNSLEMYDIRSGKCLTKIIAAHSMPARDVDSCASAPHTIVTGGDDCKAKIWDMRLISNGNEKSKPLHVLNGHTHWIWSVAICPEQTSLVLSGSSDCTVSLWHVGSLSEAATQQKSAITSEILDIHEDSVYSVCWSKSEEWVFASISYDGRVVVSMVPSNIKYKVLI